VKKKSSDSQPYRAVHLGSVFIWGVTSSTMHPVNERNFWLLQPIYFIVLTNPYNFQGEVFEDLECGNSFIWEIGSSSEENVVDQ